MGDTPLRDEDQEGRERENEEKKKIKPDAIHLCLCCHCCGFFTSLGTPCNSRSGYHCQDAMDLPTYFFLNKVCEDCFALYRDTDVYSACRSGCFSSIYFNGCMDTLMVDKETQLKAARYIRATRGGNRRY